MDHPGVHLTRSAENTPEIDALAGIYGGRVGIDDVVAHLDRRARRAWAPGTLVRRAWTWDAVDRGDPRWWPQGISATDAPDLLVVSWYAKDGGSRLTFLDLARRRYRHVLLVVPALGADGPTYEPLRVHAGGVAWHGRYLHVAATARGFWTCHADDVLRTPEGYVLPMRFAYRASADDGTERLRYSFLSIDAAATPPELVVGEYGGRRQTHRLARFGFDQGSSLLASDADGVARPGIIDEGVVRAQGVARVRGRYYATSSHGRWALGSLWVGDGSGPWREHRWAVPMGPEDLAYDDRRDRLWTVTEHPRRRWVLALRRP